MNTAEAARTLGQRGGSSRTPLKAEAARRNGALGGRNGLIYEPRGRAREYAALACNIYRGCDHGCTYCYAPKATFIDREQFANPIPRANLLNNLEKAARERTGTKDQILLCFTCDPYQRLDEECKHTREAIEILHKAGLNACILTKGGLRAARDIDLFTPQDTFASTLTFLSDADSLRWEPGAALPQDRIYTIQEFHYQGIPTWVSLEPTIDPAQSLEIIHQTHDFVDLYKVGRLNYHPGGREVDWAKYTRDAISLIQSVGRSYIVKNDLAQFVPPGLPQSLAISPV